jgi:hypothetical protein
MSIPAEQAAAIRQKVLEALGSETDRNVRNKISHAVAELARQYTENSEASLADCRDILLKEYTDNPWPELLGSLFQLSQATEPAKRECAFRVFTTTPAIIESQHESNVLEAFQKGFSDEAVSVCG